MSTNTHANSDYPLAAVQFSRLTKRGIMLGLSLPQGPRADPGHVRDAPAIHEEFDGFADPGFRVLPLREAVQIAHQRFRGKLIAARLKPPSPQERARGVELAVLVPPRRGLELGAEATDQARVPGQPVALAGAAGVFIDDGVGNLLGRA